MKEGYFSYLVVHCRSEKTGKGNFVSGLGWLDIVADVTKRLWHDEFDCNPI